MYLQGLVYLVYKVTAGSQVTEAHSAGSTSLQIIPSDRFSPTGGLLYLPEHDVIATYTSYDGEDAVLHLESPLSVDLEEEDIVEVYPNSYEKRAKIVLEDNDEESIDCLVPFSMQATFPEGTRHETTDYDVVQIEEVNGEWVIKNIIGTPSRLEYDTVPKSDGIAPSDAPVIVVEPFAVGGVEATWAPVVNADPVTYEVHASLTTPVEEDSSTYVGETYGTTYYTFSSIGGVTLTPSSPVYVKVRAKDLDGAGPFSNEDSATPVSVDLSGLQEDLNNLQDDLNDLDVELGNKNRVWYQNNEPPLTGNAVGDTWVDTNDGNKNYRWSGSAWVEVPLGISALNPAISGDIAEGKTNNKTYALPTAPIIGMRAGDVWLDTDNGNRMHRYNGTDWIDVQDDAIDDAQQSAIDASNAAASAAGIAAGKGKVIIQSSAPAVADRLPQNLWIDTTGGANTPKRWSGSAWVAVTDKTAIDAASAAASAQSAANAAQATANNAVIAANGKNKNYYQPSAPSGTGHANGDTWFDTDDGNKIYHWSTSTNTWVPAQLGVSALTPAVSGDIAEGKAKNKTFAQTTQPSSGMQTGDVWVDTDDGNKMYRYNGSNWINIQDGSIAAASSAASAANQAAINANNAAASAAGIAAGKGKVWFQTSAPAGNANDLWIDTTGGANTPKRWSGSAWVAVTDKTAIDAASAAASANSAAIAAQSTANSKNKTFIQSGTPSPPTASAIGDIWIDTSNNNELKRWNGTTWASARDATIAIADGKAVAAQNAANQAIQDAEDANDEALAAAGIANSKGKVIIQPTAPAVADRLPQNLWIDTTGSANTPKRWVGSPTNDWVAVTDKVATDAAAAAVTADGKAVAAQTAANTAQTTANGKNKIIRSTLAASGTDYKTGDMWWRMGGVGNTEVIAMWTYNEATTPKWQPQTLTDSVVTNLNANTITAGTISADRINTAALTIGGSTLGIELASKATPEDIEQAKSTNYGYRYYKSIIVNGDHDKYYPVLMTGGDQNVKRELLIKRSYNEMHPPEWNTPTHGGGLTLKLKWNYGGWGGASYSWEVHELEESYNPTFAGAMAGQPAGMGGYVFLRGGGAIYHLYSDQPLDQKNSIVLNDGSLTEFDRPAPFTAPTQLTYKTNTSYTWDVPAHRTEPAEEEIRIRKFISLSQETAGLTDGWKTTGQTTIDGGKITADSIESAQIAANAISTSELAAGAITAGSGIIANLAITENLVAAGAITAAKVAAKSITADKLFIGDLSNMALDPLMGSPLGINWVGVNMSAAAGSSISSTKSFANTAAGTCSLTSKDFIPVQAGRDYWIAAELYRASGTTSIGVQFYTKSGTALGAVQIGATKTTPSWEYVGGQVTAPVNASQAKIVFSGTGATAVSHQYVTGVVMRQAAAGELIVDGTITANKIQAGSISSSTGVIGTLDAGSIVTGFISSDRIQANSITIGKVSGLQTSLDSKETPSGAQSKANTAQSNAITAAATAASATYGETKNLVSGWKFTGTTNINGGAIQTDTITAVQIAANAITTSELSAGAVTAAKIGAGQITASALGAGSITASAIQAGAIRASSFAAGTIESFNISADQITSGSINSDLGLVNKLFVGNNIEIDGATSSLTLYKDADYSVPLVKLNPTESFFRGEVDATNLKVRDSTHLYGETRVKMGSSLAIDDSNSNPTAALNVSSGTIPTQLLGATTGTDQVVSITWDAVDNVWLRAFESGLVERFQDNGTKLTSVTLPRGPEGVDYLTHVIRSGSNYYASTSDGIYSVIYKYNLSGAIVGSVGDVGYYGDPNNNPVVLVSDGTTLTALYQRWVGGGVVKMDYHRFTQSTMAKTSLGECNANLDDSVRIVGARRVSATVHEIAMDSGMVFRYNSSGNDLFHTFVSAPVETPISGKMAYHPTLYWHYLSTSGTRVFMNRLNQYKKNPSSIPWLTYILIDSVNGYISNYAWPFSLDIANNQFAIIQQPDRLENEATGMRIFSTFKSPGVEPDTVDWRERPEPALTIGDSKIYRVDLNTSPTSTGIPTAVPFPSGTRGYILSESGGFYVTGDGDGRWPYLEQRMTLPDPLRAYNTGAVTLSAGSVNTWYVLTTVGTLSFGTLDRDLLVEAMFSAQIANGNGAGGGYGMLGVLASGGLTLEPEVNAFNGQNPAFYLTPLSPNLYSTRTVGHKQMVIPAGTPTTFQFVVRRNVTGVSPTFSYSQIVVNPLKWMS